MENEAFYSHVLTLNIDGKPQQAVIKAMQRHPAKNTPLHADFLRVDATHKLTMKVPLHYLNQDTCVGVKSEGGAISIIATDVEVACLPANLPEYIDCRPEGRARGYHPAPVQTSCCRKAWKSRRWRLVMTHDQPIANVHKKPTRKRARHGGT
jgi:large subunit ribosomal protein L25